MSIPQSGGGPIESYDQLVNYLADGCKPKQDWRIGTEHEKFGYNKETLLPLPYEGDCSIRAMLEGLRDGHGWDPVEEGGKLIGLVKDGANISLEPGGQLELSGAPVETIHETCDEVNTHLREVRDVADRIGLGAAPEWSHDQMDLMPKGRYKLMNEYMTKVGTMGRVMMRRTCTVQVNLDFGSEADMVQKLRVALALQPVATALLANSPFFEASPTAINHGAAACGVIWMRRVRACCPGCLKTAWALNVGWNMRSMCRCILFTAMGSISMPGAVFPRLPERQAACAARGNADAERLGGPPDHRLPRGADQEIHRNARC